MAQTQEPGAREEVEALKRGIAERYEEMLRAGTLQGSAATYELYRRLVELVGVAEAARITTALVEAVEKAFMAELCRERGREKDDRASR